jgi:probable addiction module antidote protein
MTENARHPPTRSYKDDLFARLRDREDRGAGYLDAALEEGAQTFLLALKDVIDAAGGETALARKTGLHRVSLHKIASGRGNPTLTSLASVLDALGLRLAVIARSAEVDAAQPHPGGESKRRSAGTR